MYLGTYITTAQIHSFKSTVVRTNYYITANVNARTILLLFVGVPHIKLYTPDTGYNYERPDY